MEWFAFIVLAKLGGATTNDPTPRAILFRVRPFFR